MDSVWCTTALPVDAVTTNPPGATKAVLEDGLLGDIQNSDVSGKLDFIAPTISDANEGSDVTLTFETVRIISARLLHCI